MLPPRLCSRLATGIATASWAATEYLAWHAGSPPALGTPLLRLGHIHLFEPWAGWQWATQWAWTTPRPFLHAAGIFVGLTLVCTTLALRREQGGMGRRAPPAMTGHGSTTWATTEEIRQAGLLAPQGWVLGRWGRQVLRYNGEENVLLVGPQRSGKGTGPLISSLLDSQERHAIVLDIRGATYAQTAGWRGQFSRVLKVSLCEPGSARFSLPQVIRRGTPHEFFDAATIAEMHMHSATEQGSERFWSAVGRAFLTCALLYEAHTRLRPTMAHIAQFWSQPGQEVLKTLAMVVEKAPTPLIATLGQEVLQKEPREVSGILSTLLQHLFVYRDPTLAANTAACDFSLDDFTRQDQWETLYLVQSPGEEEHVRPFLRALLALALRRWMEPSPQPHAIDLYLDEFTSLGHLDFVAKDLAYLGGYGIRTLLAIQNIPQLRIYGHPDVITEQCKVRVFFAANGQTTGQEISRQTGVGTAVTVQEGERTRRWSWGFAEGWNRQAQRHARPLVTGDEAMRLPPGVAVVQVAEHAPIWARKLRFWERRIWRQRSRVPLPPEVRRGP